MIRTLMASLFLALSAGAHAADFAATAVLDRSLAAYAALSTYEDDGVVESDSTWDMPFSTVFARPYRLRFEWMSRHPFVLAYFEKTSFTVVADGSRVLFRRVRPDGTIDDRTMPAFENAVAAGTGVSSGSIHRIATLLMPDLWPDRDFGASVLSLGDPHHRGVESIEGVRCDHLSNVSKKGVKRDVRIGVDDHLVRRIDEDYGQFKTSELHRHLRTNQPVTPAQFTARERP